MASTVFQDFNPATPIVASWLNDVNTATYETIPALEMEVAALQQEIGTQITPIAAAVVGGALVATLNPATLSFRSAALGSGAITSLSNATALSISVPAGATLGLQPNVQSTVTLLALNNSGVISLGVINNSGAQNLDEENLLNTVAMTSAANSTGVVYSATALTGVPYRVVGIFTVMQATAGLWADPPTFIQGVGGMAVLAEVLPTPLIGQSTNLSASLAAAGTTLILTADEVFVGTALGGPSRKLGRFSQTVSTALSGIGGVVGAALTASGYAAIYAAYNPATDMQGAFIVNANAIVPTVAVTPPMGWIATGLISVWPLNSSIQFVIASLRGRKINILAALGGSGISAASFTPLSLAGIVPMNARSIEGDMSTLANTSTIFILSPTVQGVGRSQVTGSSPLAITSNFVSDLVTPQTIYYYTPASTGTFYVDSYTI